AVEVAAQGAGVFDQRVDVARGQLRQRIDVHLGVAAGEVAVDVEQVVDPAARRGGRAQREDRFALRAKVTELQGAGAVAVVYDVVARAEGGRMTDDARPEGVFDVHRRAVGAVAAQLHRAAGAGVDGQLVAEGGAAADGVEDVGAVVDGHAPAVGVGAGDHQCAVGAGLGQGARAADGVVERQSRVVGGDEGR